MLLIVNAYINKCHVEALNSRIVNSCAEHPSIARSRMLGELLELESSLAQSMSWERAIKVFWPASKLNWIASLTDIDYISKWQNTVCNWRIFDLTLAYFQSGRHVLLIGQVFDPFWLSLLGELSYHKIRLVSNI